MTFRLNDSVTGFGDGDMSFADPYLEPSHQTTRARIAVQEPRAADFEIDPHSQWDDIEEEDDEDEVKGSRQSKNHHLAEVSPRPLTSGMSSFPVPISPDATHMTPRGRNHGSSATSSSRSPSSRSSSTRQSSRIEEMHASRQSSRRRQHVDADSPKKLGSISLSPHHRVSRRHLLQDQRAQSQDMLASSSRRLSEPSRRNIRLAALELANAMASQEGSPTSSSSRRSSEPPSIQSKKSDSSPTSQKASHHRRSLTSRASSRRNLLLSPRSDPPDHSSPHQSGSSSGRRKVDRSSSDGQAEVRRSATGTSSRALVAPSKSDTRTYNAVGRQPVARSASEGSPLPLESWDELPYPNLSSSPSKPKEQVSNNRSKSPSRSRRRTSRSQQEQQRGDDGREAEKHRRTRSRSKSRRAEGSSRRERRISSPSNGKDKPRARSKSRDASSRRHNLRTSGARMAKANEKMDALKLLQSMLVTQESEDNDDTVDTSEDRFGRHHRTLDPMVRDNPPLDISSPNPSPRESLTLSARRRASPGLPLAAGSPAHYAVSNQLTKEKKEESRVRRSNIMKSLKDFLQVDAENLKVEVLEDGTKRLVVDLSDLNTVMQDFANHRR